VVTASSQTLLHFLRFSGGEPVDKTYTVLAGRLGQSDANSSQEESLSIRRLHFSQGETVDQMLTQFSQGD